MRMGASGRTRGNTVAGADEVRRRWRFGECGVGGSVGEAGGEATGSGKLVEGTVDGEA